MPRIEWNNISQAARQTSEDLVGKDWVQASIKARILLADLADVHDILVAALREIAGHSEWAMTLAGQPGPSTLAVDLCGKARAALALVDGGEATR